MPDATVDDFRVFGSDDAELFLVPAQRHAHGGDAVERMGRQRGEPSCKLFLPKQLACLFVIARGLGANRKNANGARALPAHFA